MKTYISILRGINVSGKNIIKMDALRNLYDKLGFQNITTYVQSGNVIFTTEKSISEKKLAQLINQEIKKEFDFDVPVIVLSVDQLKQIINENLFAKDNNKDEASLYVTFLSTIPEKPELQRVDDKKLNAEQVLIKDNAIYLYCPNGYGKTKLNNNFWESKLKVLATTRNWKTTNELLNIANRITKTPRS